MDHSTMKLHPLTLKYSGAAAALEKDFQHICFRASLPVNRAALLIGIVFYSAFGILDMLILPAIKTSLWTIRFAVVDPLLFALFLFSFTRLFERWMNPLLCGAVLAAGGGIIAMIVIAPPPVSYSYYTGLLLVFMWVYSCARLPFAWASASGWLLTALYETAAILVIPSPLPVWLGNNFFYISANIIGMIACYSLEYYTRRNYFLTRQIETEREKVQAVNRELQQEIPERRRVEQELRESEERYRTFIDASADIIFLKDEQLRNIVINRTFADYVGQPEKEIIGRNDFELLPPAVAAEARQSDREVLAARAAVVREEIIGRQVFETIKFPVEIGPGKTGVGGFIRNITARKQAEEALKNARAELESRVAERTQELTAANADLRELLLKQDVNIELAKNILAMINYRPSRHTLIAGSVDIFFTAYYLPCYAEGGDHYFVRDFSDHYAGVGKTVLSLKDQSGHEVSCILRSIITDLLHNALLVSSLDSSLEETVSQLNREICTLPFFGEDNFFTAINAEINHRTLQMRFLAAGHPPLLLIRGRDVFCMPSPDEPGRNLPVGVSQTVEFQSGEIQLAPGDRLIFSTDGLGEMPHKDGRPVLGPEDLRDIAAALVRDEPQLPIAVLLPRLFNRINGREGDSVTAASGFDDDITLLGLELEDSTYEYEDIVRPENLDGFDNCVNELYRKIAAEWEKNGFTAAEKRLRMVLQEAMVNAWLHGNRQDPAKSITVRRRYGNDAVLEVADEGSGFDFATFYDPTAKENILKAQGRGNFIIRLLAEETQWKDGGRRLLVFFAKEDSGRLTAKSFTAVNIWRRFKRI